MATWLVSLILDQAAHVQAPAGNIMLCSCTETIYTDCVSLQMSTGKFNAAGNTVMD